MSLFGAGKHGMACNNDCHPPVVCRCHGRVSELTPAPVIIPESPDADNSLVFETSEWVQNWVSQVSTAVAMVHFSSLLLSCLDLGLHIIVTCHAALGFR